MASSKTLISCLAILLLLSIISFSESRDLPVGSNKALWQIPASADDYNNWAAKHRFRIGDSIVFKYDGKTDSVVQVTEEGYRSCNTSNPIKSYNDGDTKVVLDKSGPFFFISGAEGHCEKGQKLVIKVLSAKHSHPPLAAPPEEQHHSPAPAPHKSGASMLKVGFIGSIAVAGVLALV